MPKSCAARQCCNRYSSLRKQLTFHRFPFSRPELLKEWVLNIGRAGFRPKQHTVICSEHFRPECFSAFGNRTNLKHNAVPTVFAFRESAQVRPKVGVGEHSPDGSLDATREELQLQPGTKMPVAQAAGSPRAPYPGQPPDHSYALLDAAALKGKLVRTLQENAALRRRLRAQRLLLRRMCGRLRAAEGRRGPRPSPS
ncbi:THAP domain-containing protein 3 isoform X2 [Cavia porcellus]|uniref:THAP domain-containing protein 3 isoform X2 n=1 Tax=Cavia porcellus TaxID=10141 RepID=UPI002FE038EE